MNLNELNDRWNELRNAVMDRAGNPAINDAALAHEIDSQNQRWRKWWMDQGSLDELMPVSVIASDWIALLRQLQTRASKAGAVIAPSTIVPQTAPEAVASALEQIPILIVGGVVVVGLGFLLVKLIGGSNRG